MLEFPAERSAPPRKEPWTVTRLNREVRSCLESRLGAVWVVGEISNLRRQPSGHSYFSLKDESCQVSCVMFRGASPGAGALRDGMQVEIFGEIGVYEPRGQYQIIVRRAQARGAGELEAKLRALHEKLRNEGLFDQDRKRALPPHPVRVGVVTSPAGAAIRDFLHILARRAPHIEVFIAPVRVQGRGAAAEIALAVSQFADPVDSSFPAVDVIVVTRGGGSLEDLWEFNEEDVARAIAASAVPVISAVGHETDVTTSDLVADVRAPTPSAAAEILSSDRAEIFNRLAYLLGRMERETSSRLELAREQLRRHATSGAFASPRRRVADLRLLADDLSERSTLAVGRRLALLREGAFRARSILRARSPASQLATLRERLGALDMRRAKAVASALQMRRQLHARLRHELELLGPRQTLARGFTVTMDASRRAITSSETAAKQPELITLFADGEVTSHPE
ncbi:MAG: exodeoxyribonuclease VII large subunit [Chthoniobacterales bacterium]|nr:exodeoxyribonuclease VII large subunit [Chthoniobacterales bacterium]